MAIKKSSSLREFEEMVVSLKKSGKSVTGVCLDSAIQTGQSKEFRKFSQEFFSDFAGLLEEGIVSDDNLDAILLSRVSKRFPVLFDSVNDTLKGRVVSFPIKESEVVPLLLSDKGFVRNFGGRERVCSFIDIFEKRYGGLDRLVAAFHAGSASLFGNRTVYSLLLDLEHNSDSKKGLDIRYDDLVSLYTRISECCGVKDNAHFALPQRISFEGKQYIMPGYGVIDFYRAEEINGRPVFFGRDNRRELESVFSFEGKLLDDSTVYEPFSVMDCGDVRFLCKTVVTDWDYMLSTKLLKNYDGKILLRGKDFHWDTEKGCLSVHTIAGNVKTMSSEELKGLLVSAKTSVQWKKGEFRGKRF